jgi:hypothetical protein
VIQFLKNFGKENIKLNLISRNIEESNINKFRQYQYELWKDFIIYGLQYLIKLGLRYDPNYFDPVSPQIDVIPDIAYNKINHFATSIIKISLIPKITYVQFSFPELVDGMFFKLNGVLYCPILYILDEPIILKKKSILLKSLFQPITLFLENKRAIFMGINIHINDFLQLLTHSWTDEEKYIIQKELNVNLYSKHIDELIDQFSKKLNTEKDYDAIKNRINEIFFDSWSMALFQKFYNVHPDIDNVLKIAIKRRIENKSELFIDLRYKRLSFIEPLLNPFSKSIRQASLSLIKGHQPKQTLIGFDSIIKMFFNELHGNVFYDTVNGLSSILAHKATFKNPFGTERLPSIVSAIHPTHKGRICPNTISNHDPGEMISLVPNQKIDLETGRFLFSDDELIDIENKCKHI